MGEWGDFFVAEVGASAALAGLVIVAISINLARIMSLPALPGRAAETLVAPTGVLVTSSFMLVPHQPAGWLAGELLAAGAVMWLMPSVIQFQGARSGSGVPFRAFAVRFVLTQLSSLPIIAAGVLLLKGAPDAIGWMVPGVIAALITTVINAWVLLVEILR